MRTGTWISASIESLPINSSAKIILAEIDNLHKSKGCFAGNTHFAKILGVSTETVSRIISKLRKLGYVNQTRFDGRIRTLEPCFENAFETKQNSKPVYAIESKQSLPKGQSRDDQLHKADFTIYPNPLVHKEQLNKNINNSNSVNQKSLPKFLEWSKGKFSGSTREILQSLNSLESLLGCENRTIRLA